MTIIVEISRRIKEARKKGDSIKGKTRDLISEETGLGVTQAQKYLSFAKHADEKTKEALKKQEITFREAYNVAVSKKNEKYENIEKLITSLSPLKRYNKRKQSVQLTKHIQGIEEILQEDMRKQNAE
jgi:hypothetical protein